MQNMVYTVYVIKDESKNIYSGYTSNIEARMWEHNNRITKSTRKGKNWKIAYTKEFEIKKDAIQYELFLKSGKGRDFLKTWGVV